MKVPLGVMISLGEVMIKRLVTAGSNQSKELHHLHRYSQRQLHVRPRLPLADFLSE